MNDKYQSSNAKYIWTLVFVILILPIFAWAHEVYVLPEESIESAMNAPSPDPFLAYFGNESEFIFWGFISFIVVATILCATIFRLFEPTLSPLLSPLKKWALPIVRITTGLSLLSFGLAGQLYGTEIPFHLLFGGGSAVAEIVLLLLGVAVLVGFWTRVAALVSLALFAYAGSVLGWYMLTYADHAGAYIALILLGSGILSLDKVAGRGGKLPFFELTRFSHLAFPLLRIFFGIGIMFASIYAKYVHSQLALDVVVLYDLTRFFPFDPLFIVLGALIVEFLAGLLLVFGIAVRWTNIFLLFWLSLSLIYFQEAVWPHIILFGIAAALFCHGYDRFSLEGYVLKRRGREPLL